MGICSVSVSPILLCRVMVNKIPSCSVAVISNRCAVFLILNQMVLGETTYLTDPLQCCGLLFEMRNIKNIES